MNEDVAKLVCRNWTVVALNREGWWKVLKKAEAHPGCSAVGERERETQREREPERERACKAHDLYYTQSHVACPALPYLFT
jgi:hypothetical protein